MAKNTVDSLVSDDDIPLGNYSPLLVPAALGQSFLQPKFIYPLGAVSLLNPDNFDFERGGELLNQSFNDSPFFDNPVQPIDSGSTFQGSSQSNLQTKALIQRSNLQSTRSPNISPNISNFDNDLPKSDRKIINFDNNSPQIQKESNDKPNIDNSDSQQLENTIDESYSSFTEDKTTINNLLQDDQKNIDIPINSFLADSSPIETIQKSSQDISFKQDSLEDSIQKQFDQNTNNNPNQSEQLESIQALSSISQINELPTLQKQHDVSLVSNNADLNSIDDNLQRNSIIKDLVVSSNTESSNIISQFPSLNTNNIDVNSLDNLTDNPIQRSQDLSITKLENQSIDRKDESFIGLDRSLDVQKKIDNSAKNRDTTNDLSSVLKNRIDNEKNDILLNNLTQDINPINNQSSGIFQAKIETVDSIPQNYNNQETTNQKIFNDFEELSSSAIDDKSTNIQAQFDIDSTDKNLQKNAITTDVVVKNTETSNVIGESLSLSQDNSSSILDLENPIDNNSFVQKQVDLNNIDLKNQDFSNISLVSNSLQTEQSLDIQKQVDLKSEISTVLQDSNTSSQKTLNDPLFKSDDISTLSNNIIQSDRFNNQVQRQTDSFTTDSLPIPSENLSNTAYVTNTNDSDISPPVDISTNIKISEIQRDINVNSNRTDINDIATNSLNRLTSNSIQRSEELPTAKLENQAVERKDDSSIELVNNLESDRPLDVQRAIDNTDEHLQTSQNINIQNLQKSLSVDNQKNDISTNDLAQDINPIKNQDSGIIQAKDNINNSDDQLNNFLADSSPIETIQKSSDGLFEDISLRQDSLESSIQKQFDESIDKTLLSIDQNTSNSTDSNLQRNGMIRDVAVNNNTEVSNMISQSTSLNTNDIDTNSSDSLTSNSIQRSQDLSTAKSENQAVDRKDDSSIKLNNIESDRSLDLQRAIYNSPNDNRKTLNNLSSIPNQYSSQSYNYLALEGTLDNTTPQNLQTPQNAEIQNLQKSLSVDNEKNELSPNNLTQDINLIKNQDSGMVQAKTVDNISQNYNNQETVNQKIFNDFEPSSSAIDNRKFTTLNNSVIQSDRFNNQVQRQTDSFTTDSLPIPSENLSDTASVTNTNDSDTTPLIDISTNIKISEIQRDINVNSNGTDTNDIATNSLNRLTSNSIQRSEDLPTAKLENQAVERKDSSSMELVNNVESDCSLDLQRRIDNTANDRNTRNNLYSVLESNTPQNLQSSQNADIQNLQKSLNVDNEKNDLLSNGLAQDINLINNQDLGIVQAKTDINNSYGQQLENTIDKDYSSFVENKTAIKDLSQDNQKTTDVPINSVLVDHNRVEIVQKSSDILFEDTSLRQDSLESSIQKQFDESIDKTLLSIDQNISNSTDSNLQRNAITTDVAVKKIEASNIIGESLLLNNEIQQIYNSKSQDNSSSILDLENSIDNNSSVQKQVDLNDVDLKHQSFSDISLVNNALQTEQFLDIQKQVDLKPDTPTVLQNSNIQRGFNTSSQETLNDSLFKSDNISTLSNNVTQSDRFNNQVQRQTDSFTTDSLPIPIEDLSSTASITNNNDSDTSPLIDISTNIKIPEIQRDINVNRYETDTNDIATNSLDSLTSNPIQRSEDLSAVKLENQAVERKDSYSTELDNTDRPLHVQRVIDNIANDVDTTNKLSFVLESNLDSNTSQNLQDSQKTDVQNLQKGLSVDNENNDLSPNDLAQDINPIDNQNLRIVQSKTETVDSISQNYNRQETTNQEIFNDFEVSNSAINNLKSTNIQAKFDLIDLKSQNFSDTSLLDNNLQTEQSLDIQKQVDLEYGISTVLQDSNIQRDFKTDSQTPLDNSSSKLKSISTLSNNVIQSDRFNNQVQTQTDSFTTDSLPIPREDLSSTASITNNIDISTNIKTPEIQRDINVNRYETDTNDIAANTLDSLISNPIQKSEDLSTVKLDNQDVERQDSSSIELVNNVESDQSLDVQRKIDNSEHLQASQNVNIQSLQRNLSVENVDISNQEIVDLSNTFLNQSTLSKNINLPELSNNQTVLQMMSDKNVATNLRLPQVLQNLGQTEYLGAFSSLRDSEIESTSTRIQPKYDQPNQKISSDIQENNSSGWANIAELLSNLPPPKISSNTSANHLNQKSANSSDRSYLTSSSTNTSSQTIVQRSPDHNYQSSGSNNDDLDLYITPKGLQRDNPNQKSNSQSNNQSNIIQRAIASQQESADLPEAQVTVNSITDSYDIQESGNFEENLTALAQEIYILLRQRLEIEKERQGSRYQGRLPW